MPHIIFVGEEFLKRRLVYHTKGEREVKRADVFDDTKGEREVKRADVFDDWVRSHPNAKGLRHKSCSHYDSLLIVFKKDRATGTAIETLADAVEELEIEDTNHNDAEMDVNVEVEGQSNVSVKEDVVGSTCQTGTGGPSRKAVNNKKWKVRKESIADLMDQMGRFVKVFEGTREEIKEIVSFFKRETKEKDIRRMLFNAIAKLDGFPIDDILEVGEAICKEPYKIELFFELSMNVRRAYVRNQLTKSNVYHPSFNP